MKKKIIKILKESMTILILVLLVSLGYRLKLVPVLICLTMAIVFGILYEKQEVIRRKYLKRFTDLILYMEQFIYSFKKQPKIRLAINDAGKVSTDKMKELIEEVIVNLDSKTDYENALALFYKDYDCRRLRALHEFVIKIEKTGGDYEDYIDVLLDDIKEWNDRTTLFIKDVERIKRNVLISIFSTLITCGFMSYLIPSNYGYTDNNLYQICSTIVIVFMMLAYLLVVKNMNINWLKDKKILPDNLVIKYYVLVEKGFENKSSLTFFERISYKKAKRRIEAEINKAFPDWIREVAINLQNETVQSAIENSYETLPLVLKRPVRTMLVDFEKYPVGIEPYDNFLKEFDLIDIKSSMKMFYSLNELGSEQSTKQIKSIIDRNNKLVKQSEEMKNKDKVGAASLYTALPMIIGVFKIMVDMILMIIVFTSSISNAINGG